MEYIEITQAQAIEIKETVFTDNHILPIVEIDGKYYVQASTLGYYAYESLLGVLSGKQIIHIEPQEVEDEL